ncbi:MAG: AAA family ATPase [Firmicutes bacterium]|nr:AAA family ATPase [Bacillota bacterium]
MFKDNPLLKAFTDNVSEGLIFIDNNGKIQLYNKRAKEIFGVIYEQGEGHSLGKISIGDIVIIADNCLGRDDGGLKSKDLSLIGIEDENISKNDAIVAVGLYKDKTKKASYKYDKNKNNSLKLNTNYLGLDIYIEINFNKKNIIIDIDNKEYRIDYINSVGHMVLINGKNKELKFYQAKGYTIRKESLKEILFKRPFSAKGKESDILNVIGKDIFETHGYISAIKKFYKAAKGENISYEDKFVEINGRPTLCSLIPIDNDNKRIGALLKVKEISELKKLTKQRDEALFKLGVLERKLKNSSDIESLFPELVGKSEQINQVKKLALKASKTNSTLLILGESGTGKSLLAREIHNESSNKKGPFIEFNCASIPENLLESELFGYEKGAFTGAKNEGKMGYFEMAMGGTIFLDEIGEMPPSMQVKLLSVLQSKSFYRVGGTKKIDVNLRVIAATNKDLEKEVIKGRFREDLFYRINVFPITLPPLRDRKQDIYSLVYTLLPDICKKVGSNKKEISVDALNKLIKYNWPGNIRELENILERAVNLTEGDILLPYHIIINSEDNNVESLKDVVKEAEKKAIKQALERTNGNRKEAMKILKIGKTSFYDKLKKYNINTPHSRNTVR